MRLDFSDIEGGFILSDADLTPASGWFEPDYWTSRGTGAPIGKGRGQAITAGETGDWVLRHYHRGGLPGRFVDDAYLWHGPEKARPVREMRILAALHERDAPVVRPVAARVLRSGLCYRGDILTERVREARTLGDMATTLDDKAWQRIGAELRRFHEAGGWHADLNAHNILMAASGIFIIDLDRGRLVTPGGRGQRRNLDRLHRSLSKQGLLPAVERGWQALLAAYHHHAPASGK